MYVIQTVCYVGIPFEFKLSFGRNFFLQINGGVIVVGLINDHVFFLVYSMVTLILTVFQVYTKMIFKILK